MKMKELKELETKDLAEKLENAVAAYDQMKLNHNITQLAHASEIQSVRRDIDRIQKGLRQRELNK